MWTRKWQEARIRPAMTKLKDILKKVDLKESASPGAKTERDASQIIADNAQSRSRADEIANQHVRWPENLDFEIPEEGKLPFIGGTLRDIRDTLKSQKRAGKLMLWIAVATLLLVAIQFALNTWLDWDQLSAIWAD